MVSFAGVFTFALLLGCGGSPQAPPPHKQSETDLYPRCVSLLSQQCDTGTISGLKRINQQFDSLAARDGKVALVQTLELIAEGRVWFRLAACRQLKRYMSKQQ